MRFNLVVGQLLVFSAVALAALLASGSSGGELPPEVQVDRLLVQAEREIEDGEHWSAVFTFERILAVCEEHGLAIPTEFWFRQAGVLHSAGLDERAIEASTRYLKEAGRDGEHYQAVLELLDAAEVGLAEARRAEARARVAAERAEREIAAAIPEMVVIPAGTFRMGCLTRRGCEEDEKPVREVHVSSFALATYELTFAQWDACTEYGPCRSVPDEGWGRGDRPVVNVSFDDVQVYLGWLSRETGESYRLPSEAEWEYAARAGMEARYSWGDEIGTNRANCEGCGSQWDGRQTAPVGSFPPNPFDLHDMHGNVWEWVRDCWNDNYRGAPSDGNAWLLGNCDRRVLRGGSWGDNPKILRAAFRGRLAAGIRSNYSGFRVARTLPLEPLRPYRL